MEKYKIDPKLYGLKDTKANREALIKESDPRHLNGAPPDSTIDRLVEKQMENIPEWIVVNPIMNFGKPSENYATEIYVGGLSRGTDPAEIMANEEDLDYENFQKVNANVGGVELYTYRKGDYDYLILEFDGGDYPSHYITLRQCHGAAPFQERE